MTQADLPHPGPLAPAPGASLVQRTRPLWTAGAVVATVVAVFFLLGAVHLYNLPFILEYLPTGVGPALTSLLLTSLSFGVGFFLALPLAILRAFPPRRSPRAPMAPPPRSGLFRTLGLGGRWLAYGAASGYVQAVRGTPFLVQMFVVYYAFLFSFPRLIILNLPVAFWAGLIALTINTTGYQAEALRGGFQSVDASQVEAARGIGLTRSQIFWRVTFPQGIRLVTLPLTNEWISNFKTSTILQYISVAELFYWSRTYIAAQLARPIEAFVMLTMFYLAVNVTLSRVLTYVEARRRIPGLGSPVPEIAARPA